MRNSLTRPISWKICESRQLQNAIDEVGFLAESLFVRCLVTRDHLGRMQADRNYLKAILFPIHKIEPDDLKVARDCLDKNGLIIVYETNGIEYIQFPKVGKYSRIAGNMREESLCPEPSAEVIRLWETKFNDKFEPCIRRKNSVRTEYEQRLNEGGTESKPRSKKVPSEREGERESEEEGEGEDKRHTPKKQKYVDHVYMTEDEYSKLLDKYGSVSAQRYIESLNAYIHQIGIKKAKSKYKSHYHTILNWIRKDEQNNGTNQKTDAGLAQRNRRAQQLDALTQEVS